MTWLWYLWRSIVYYRRSHLTAALGAALATAAITGSLLTGYSVRESLRTLVTHRLGATDYTLTGRGFFRAGIAGIFRPDWSSCALISLDGSMRKAEVTVYGVDDSFYRFHGRMGRAPGAGEVLLSRALAREMAAKAGDRVEVRVERPSLIPRESVQGDKDQTAQVLRLKVAPGVIAPVLDDFSIRARQGEVRALFVPLAWLQAELKLPGRANLVLLAGTQGGQKLAARLRARFQLEDTGLQLRRRSGSEELVLEHESTILDDRTAERALETARDLGVLARPAVVAMVRTITDGAHSLSYSVVAALDDASLAEVHDDQPLPRTKKPPILLNNWAAMDLAAKRGDVVTLEMPHGTGTVRAEFEVAGVVPIAGIAADRDFVPALPGISDQAEIRKWVAPFPVDGRLVRPRDQMYWELYRTTPKAWIPLDVGRKYWRTRFGSYTSVRFMQDDPGLADRLRADIDPLAGPFVFSAVRRQSVSAAAGSTDFGEYFIYFNSFVVFAALLLTVLILRLGVEKRETEMGLLLAAGSRPKVLLGIFVVEGVVVGVVGTVLGLLLAPAYAEFMVVGLRSWWNRAAGTHLLSLSVHWRMLAEGAVAGALAAAAAVWMALQNWEGLAPRTFHIGEQPDEGVPRWLRLAGWLTLAGAVALAGFSMARMLAPRAGYFAAGVCLLGAGVFWSDWLLRTTHPALVGIPGKRAVPRLALRNLAWRRRRSVLGLVLIAPCAFLLVSMETIRQKERREGTGGFSLYAESTSPVFWDGETKEGLSRLKVSGLETLRWARFRLRPGDEVSCLNLFQPRDPRILGVPASFLRSNGFRFTESTGESAETQANPWLLLESQMNGGIIPAIVDQNSLAYVLHKKVGDDLEVAREGAPPLRLRLVGALRDSVFQGELLISEQNFVRLYPHVAGWRVFLVNGPAETEGRLETALRGYGFHVREARARLAQYHEVENTYLSAFQMLGALGLLLGTAGLGVVMVRNVWERRREFAMLRAAGFAPRQLSRLVQWEMGLVLGGGLALGLICGLVAAVPALAAGGSGGAVAAMVGGLVVIFAGGMGVARLAGRLAVRLEPE